MMLMLWFPYDTHLILLVVGVAYCARHYRSRATVRRLQHLVAQDRSSWQ
jgi:hypothetical protein